MLRSRRRFLERFCRVALPTASGRFPSAEQAGTAESVVAYLESLHLMPRLGVLSLVDLVNLLPLVTGHFRLFSALDDERALAFLKGLEQSRIYVLRNGLVAIKAVVYLVYYSDPEVERLTGYADDCLEHE